MSSSELSAAGIAAATLLAACDSKQPSKPAEATPNEPLSEPPAPSYASFRTVGSVDAKAVEELNAARTGIVNQVLQRRGPVPDLQIELGVPNGLDVTVTVGDKKITHSVPPSTFGAELISNFDHTLDRTIQEAQGQDPAH